MLVLAIFAALTPLTDWEKMQKYPSLKTSFFEIYEEVEQRPYIMLVAEYWLFENPVRATINGRVTVIGREFVPAQVGDINCDGITNFIDYTIALEYYEK